MLPWPHPYHRPLRHWVETAIRGESLKESKKRALPAFWYYKRMQVKRVLLFLSVPPLVFVCVSSVIKGVILCVKLDGIGLLLRYLILKVHNNYLFHAYYNTDSENHIDGCKNFFEIFVNPIFLSPRAFFPAIVHRSDVSSIHGMHRRNALVSGVGVSRKKGHGPKKERKNYGKKEIVSTFSKRKPRNYRGAETTHPLLSWI